MLLVTRELNSLLLLLLFSLRVSLRTILCGRLRKVLTTNRQVDPGSRTLQGRMLWLSGNKCLYLNCVTGDAGLFS